MEKKRKRASFSPTMSSSSVEKKSIAKEEVREEKPVLQQVVEVVVEEQSSPPQIEESAPQLSESELREKIKQELKEELLRELAQERKNLEPPTDYTVRYKKDEPEPESKPEVEPEPEDEVVEVVAASDDVTEEEVEEEKQKETVAELFGKNSESIMPEITVHKSSGTKGLFIWAVTMVAIAIGVGGGLVVFTNRSGQSSNQQVSNPIGSNVSPTVAQAVITPTPMPKPTVATVDKKTIRVQVQNGGGVAGAGSKMKALLEQAGYRVTDVSNASSYDFTETEISVKSSNSEIRDALEEDISKTYTVGKIDTSLPESSPYDARVIVGKN